MTSPPPPPHGTAARPDPDGWRRVRRHLDTHRGELTRLAADRYPRSWQVAGTPLLAAPGWLPAEPVDLSRIRLDWVPAAPPAQVRGTEPAAAALLPPEVTRYSEAVGELARPRLFENRTTYRLLDLGWPAGTGALTFTAGRYFDVLDISEALAHELAAAHLAGRGAAELPFRDLVGDPFDPRRRPLLPAISTLTLRRERRTGDATMYLHWRDPAKVATGGGLYQVMPVGMFQPSVEPAPGAPADLDLWHGLARELSEELLGAPEHLGGDGEPFDYASWPFLRVLDEARAAGRLRVSCLGAGVDPLTLVTDLLTVAVFDDDLFDDVFGGLVGHNAEGRVLGAGVPFGPAEVRRFTREEPMQPAGAALLGLAAQQRAALL